MYYEDDIRRYRKIRHGRSKGSKSATQGTQVVSRETTTSWQKSGRAVKALTAERRPGADGCPGNVRRPERRRRRAQVAVEVDEAVLAMKSAKPGAIKS